MRECGGDIHEAQTLVKKQFSFKVCYYAIRL